MEKTLNLTLKTASGKTLPATIEKSTVMVGILGACDTNKEEKTIIHIFVEYNGKKIEVSVQICFGEGEIFEKCKAANVRYFLSGFVNDKRVIIILSAESLKELMDVAEINDQKNIDEIIEEANEIIEKAKTTTRNEDGTLMTRSQAKKYLKAYNDFYNEGGEGYLPSIITAERFEWANKTIAANKRSIN